ncbi:Glycosyl hydrolase, family 13, catalytic region domain protein, partial [marine sediment metagenome]
MWRPWGSDAVWISPFFTSPMKDFGYDVSDYCGIDPIFGTMEDFDWLVQSAHE